MQRMETSGIGDRIALLAHDELLKFYENSGFRDRGKSKVQFGGGSWNDMVWSQIRELRMLDWSDNRLCRYMNSPSTKPAPTEQLSPQETRQLVWAALRLERHHEPSAWNPTLSLTPDRV